MEAGAIGLTAAFAAGMISFLSPCVLPLVPAYVSYVAGQSHSALERRRDAHQRLAALALSSVFVLGFGVVFVALGAGASALGGLLLRYRYEANLIGGAVVIVFGVLMIGMSRGMPWLQREWRFHPNLAGGRPLAAFVLGLAFGFGWTPCIGPVLGAILTRSGCSRCMPPASACRSCSWRCSRANSRRACARCAAWAGFCRSPRAPCSSPWGSR